jgi:hypothetical protein
VPNPALPQLLLLQAAGVLSAFGEGIDLAGHNGAYLLIGLWSGLGTTPVDPTVLVHKTVENGVAVKAVIQPASQASVITHRKAPSPPAT